MNIKRNSLFLGMIIALTTTSSALPAERSYLCVPEKSAIVLFTDAKEYMSSTSFDVSNMSFLVEQSKTGWTTRGIKGHHETIWTTCQNQYSCISKKVRFGSFYQDVQGTFLATKPIQDAGIISLIGRCTAL